MREPQKVVVHYRDGSLVHGHTRFFFHDQQRIEVTDRGGCVHGVDLARVKAVFFVRDFEGDADYGEQKEFSGDSPVFGERIRIRFRDGEVLVGCAMGYRPEERGFYLQPADPRSNNKMIFIPTESLEEIRVGTLRW